MKHTDTKKHKHEKPVKGLKSALKPVTTSKSPQQPSVPANPLEGLQNALKAEQVAALAARLAIGFSGS